MHSRGRATQDASHASRSFHNRRHHHHHHASGGASGDKADVATKPQPPPRQLTATETSAELEGHQPCPRRRRQLTGSAATPDGGSSGQSAASLLTPQVEEVVEEEVVEEEEAATCSGSFTDSSDCATGGQGLPGQPRHCRISSQTTIAIRLMSNPEQPEAPTELPVVAAQTVATYTRAASSLGCRGESSSGGVSGGQPQFLLSAATWASWQPLLPLREVKTEAEPLSAALEPPPVDPEAVVVTMVTASTATESASGSSRTVVSPGDSADGGSPSPQRQSPGGCSHNASTQTCAYLPTDSFASGSLRRRPRQQRPQRSALCRAVVWHHGQLAEAAAEPESASCQLVQPPSRRFRHSASSAASADAADASVQVGRLTLSRACATLILSSRRSDCLPAAELPHHQRTGSREPLPAQATVTAHCRQPCVVAPIRLHHHRSDCSLLERLSVTARLFASEVGAPSCCGRSAALLTRLFYPEDLGLVTSLTEHGDDCAEVTAATTAAWSMVARAATCRARLAAPDAAFRVPRCGYEMASSSLSDDDDEDNSFSSEF